MTGHIEEGSLPDEQGIPVTRSPKSSLHQQELTLNMFSVQALK